MADRVLPSRDEVQHSNLDIAEPAYSIVAAYLDDELRTEPEWREIIDYEWLCIEKYWVSLNHNIRRISNLPGNEGHCYFTSKPKHLTTCGRFGLVDAALPDRDV